MALNSSLGPCGSGLPRWAHRRRSSSPVFPGRTAIARASTASCEMSCSTARSTTRWPRRGSSLKAGVSTTTPCAPTRRLGISRPLPTRWFDRRHEANSPHRPRPTWQKKRTMHWLSPHTTPPGHASYEARSGSPSATAASGRVRRARSASASKSWSAGTANCPRPTRSYTRRAYILCRRSSTAGSNHERLADCLNFCRDQASWAISVQGGALLGRSTIPLKCGEQVGIG